MKTPALTRRKAATNDPVPAASGPALPGPALPGPGPIAPAPVLAAPKRRRRPALIAAGVVLVILGALGAYYLTQQSAERIAVVGIAQQVEWGQPIAASDLVLVQIVDDPNLRPVLWSDAQSYVGQIAAAELIPGTLLTRASVTTEKIPADGFALVGVAVAESQVPVSEIIPGSIVLLVPTEGTGGSDTSTAIEPTNATVYTVGAISTNGNRTVDVIVPLAVAPQIAAEAVAGRIAVVLLPAG